MNTILLVEDDAQLRQSYVELLQDEFEKSVRILEAGNLEDAVVLLKAHRDSIVCIVLDLDIPLRPNEPPHDQPTVVGLKLLQEEGWYCPVIIFSAHENLVTEESTKQCYPWHMILKGAPDSVEQLMQQVRKGIALQEASVQILQAVQKPPYQAVTPSRVGTLAAVHFRPAALGSTSSMLLGRDWSTDAYVEGLVQLQAAVSQQGGAIVQILGTTAACVFPAIGIDLQHFQKALRALRMAFSNIRQGWNARVRARFAGGLFIGEMDGGAGLGAVYAALPAELACQIAFQVQEGQVAVPETHLTANQLVSDWNGFFGGRVTTTTIRLAGGGAAIRLSVGSL